MGGLRIRVFGFFFLYRETVERVEPYPEGTTKASKASQDCGRWFEGVNRIFEAAMNVVPHRNLQVYRCWARVQKNSETSFGDVLAFLDERSAAGMGDERVKQLNKDLALVREALSIPKERKARWYSVESD